jgi:hypothetical protein
VSRRRKKAARRPSTSQRRIYEVSFADAFSPDDLLGHFVIGLGAAQNDLLLTNRFQFQTARPRRNGR